MPQITHDEFQLMQRLKLKLLNSLTEEPGNKEVEKEYEDWLRYVEEQIKSRGLACQDCRLVRH